MGKLQTKRVKKARFKRRFLSKSQARRLLQVDHKLFKRLCILKGIYPRQPSQFRNSVGKDKIYYMTKDIRYILGDPILETLRDFDAHQKKVRSLKARGLKDEVNKLNESRPTYRLDKTIRERYPTFMDALRDMSDALTMVALYAQLPARTHSDSTIDGHVYHTTWLQEQCVNLTNRWRNIVESQHALRKGFISIKGFYFQAVIRGEESTWLVPHDFSSKHPKTVEHSMMMSFLEFYVHFLRFVFFKLEEDARQAARMESEAEPDAGAAGVSEAFPEEEDDDVDDNTKITEEAAAKKLSAKKKDLQAVLPFKNLIFYISREAVPEHVGFVVRCMGGTTVSQPTAPGVTHYILDRPHPLEDIIPGVEYLQPQYVIDCLNAKVVLPVDGYGMGEKCPPHVSPFTVSITNNTNEFSLVQRVEHRNAFTTDVPERVHEIRKAIDSTYTKGCDGLITGNDAEVASSIDSEDYDDLVAGTKMDPRHLNANTEIDSSSEEDGDSNSGGVSSTDDEEEGLDVHEDYVRSKESARAVEKQRAKNLANVPTAAKSMEARRKVLEENTTKRLTATKEETLRMKKTLQRQREQERKEGAKALLTKKVRGAYVAAAISQKRLRDKSEKLETTREELSKGIAKVNPRGYIEKGKKKA